MPSITSIDDLCDLVRGGFTEWERFGHVKVRQRNDLILFNYTHPAQVLGRWNQFEQMSRGLIIHKTGNVTARSFDKFFNWNEGGRTTSAELQSITEKIDGVLGILYRDTNGYSVATRGAFDSPEATWATSFLRATHDLRLLPDDLTLIFEIISPNHRLVIDYGDTSALVLLAARNRHTGEFATLQRVNEIASQYGFPLPRVFTFNDVADILQSAKEIDGNQEGWVAEFSDGQRFKFKGNRYLELHKRAAGLSVRTAVRAVANENVNAVRQTIPEEFLADFDSWVESVKEVVRETKDKIECIFNDAPRTNRKQFARWVMANHPKLSAYLFARWDGVALDETIYQREFK